MLLAVNVQGYQEMMKGLRPALKAAGTAEVPARVVNVASIWAGGLDMNDLQFKTRPYTANAAYMASKQANRLQTYVAARMFAADHITVNAAYPGYTTSQLTEGLGVVGTDTAEFSARTPAWAVVSDEVNGQTGQWFHKQAVAKDDWQADVEAQQKLWDAIEQLP